VSAGLLRAEVHRFRSRRFLWGIVGAGLVALLFGCGVAAHQHHKLDAAGLAAAQQQRQATLQEQQAFVDQCIKQLPAGVPAEQGCPAIDPCQFQTADFAAVRPFVLEQQLPDGVVGIGALTAAAMFLLGATWIGAEWSTRSLVALLFWEPRRTRVLLTKLGVLMVGAAAVAALAQLVWFGAAEALAATRGTRTGLPDGFYGDVLTAQGRLVLFGVLLSGLGFALANLLRNTGAALGVVALYLAVLENLIRVLQPSWQEWLLTTNAGALISRTPVRFFTTRDGTGHEVVIGHVHGGLYLTALVAGLLALGAVLFSRRDLS
jgi:hypothetical protein